MLLVFYEKTLYSFHYSYRDDISKLIHDIFFLFHSVNNHEVSLRFDNISYKYFLYSLTSHFFNLYPFEKDIIKTYDPGWTGERHGETDYEKELYVGLAERYFRVNDTPDEHRNNELERRMKDINKFFGVDPSVKIHIFPGVSQWINAYNEEFEGDLIIGNPLNNPVQRFFGANAGLSSFLDLYLILEL